MMHLCKWVPSHRAWMTYGLADIVQQRRMIDESKGAQVFKRTLLDKLSALVGLAESTHCRRTRLLSYFGETLQATKCRNCDNCLSPPKVRDGSVLAQKLLSCVYRTGERFGAAHIVDVLTGRETDRVKQFRHHLLSVFGIGADLSDKQWRAALCQLVALDHLRPDSEAFGAFKLTESARGVLKGTTTVMLREEAVSGADQRNGSRSKRGSKFVATPRDVSSQSNSLLKALRGWRLEMARTHGVTAM